MLDRGRRLALAGWPLLAVAVAAFVIRLVPILSGGGLFGAPNYDPSVYYAAAVGFNEGRLPYRDFLLLHPPGVVLWLQPSAMLGRWLGDPTGLAAARVGAMAMGGLSAALIYQLLRKGGWPAALAGAGLYAIHPAAAHVERSPWLEGPATALLLIALLVLQRAGGTSFEPDRGTKVGALPAAVAGAMLAASALTKLWGAALLLVIWAWLLVSGRVRAALWSAAGAAMAGVLILAPYLSVLPQVWRDVVLAQLGRPGVRSDPLLRAGTLFGLEQDAAAAFPAVAVGLVVLTLALTVAAARWKSGRLYLVLLATTVLVLLAAPSWYPNYPAFAAAPLALVLGSAVAAIRARTKGSGRRVIAGAVVALIGVGAVAQLRLPSGYTFPGRELGEALSSHRGCVTSDHPVSLILADRLRSNLRSGCTLMVDLSGYIHVLPGNSQRRDNPEFQQVMMDYLRGGETTIVMSGMWPGDFSKANREIVNSWPILKVSGKIAVRQPS